MCGGTLAAEKVTDHGCTPGVYPRVCGGTREVMPAAMRLVDDRVYPRVCGGTFLDRARPWGKRDSVEKVYPRVCGGTRNATRGPRPSVGRSIPACAGEPMLPRTDQGRSGITPVYPRVCGGTVTSHDRCSATLAPGSIPACAGEPPETGPRAFASVLRSIPACAGEPRTDFVPRVLSSDRRSIPACAGEPWRSPRRS